MPRFKYTARSRTGEKVEGVIEAADRRAALVQIERQGQVPVSVAEAALAATAKPARRSWFSFERKTPRAARMKIKEVLLLTRELSDLLASGMTLGDALHTLSRRKTGKAQDRLVEELRDEIIQGTSLSEALSRRSDSFPPLYVSMVRAGEASGQLAEVLERLSAHYERVQETREKVLMALIYPAIVLGVGILTLVFSMIFVVPRFTAIFEQLGSSLPLPTRILIGMSDAFVKYGWALLGVIVAATVLVRRYLATAAGRRAWHRLQLHVPVIRLIVTSNAYIHFARTLSSLLENGVQVLQALSIVEDTVGNVVIAGAIRDAREQVTDGATISGPLAAGKVFPPLLTDMLAVGEQAGDMSSALKHIAKRYDDELNRAVKILTTVLEPVLMLLMAIMVGFVAVSMLLAVFDMTNGLNV
ncbi:MAG TPA: type II secretion system F family protein [Kiritimatiellia bacterium]|nr:type II secretion system F family protein [Kiritimatiellia bacterium]HSA18876.1 type II secretion system F family protein [Kiritimatiellia bacterium]